MTEAYSSKFRQTLYDLEMYCLLQYLLFVLPRVNCPGVLDEVKSVAFRAKSVI